MNVPFQLIGMFSFCRILRKESCASIQAALNGESWIIHESENFVKFTAPFLAKISSIVGNKNCQAIVTAFDSESVTAMKLGPGNFKEDDIFLVAEKSNLLKIPSRIKDGPGNLFLTGFPEIDNIAPLTGGQVIAFTDPDGRREISRSIIAQQIKSGASVFHVAAAASGIPGCNDFFPENFSAVSSFLAFTAALRAAAACETHAVLLLTDLDFFADEFSKLPLSFSLTSAIGAAQALAGGTLTVATVGASSDFMSIGLGAQVLVSRQPGMLLRNFHQKIVPPGQLVMTRQLRERMADGLKQQQELRDRRDLKIFVDFWEDEESELFTLFLDNVKRSKGDLLMLRASILPSCNRKLSANESEKWILCSTELANLRDKAQAAGSEEEAIRLYYQIDMALHRLELFVAH